MIKLFLLSLIVFTGCASSEHWYLHFEDGSLDEISRPKYIASDYSCASHEFWTASLDTTDLAVKMKYKQPDYYVFRNGDKQIRVPACREVSK